MRWLYTLGLHAHIFHTHASEICHYYPLNHLRFPSNSVIKSSSFFSFTKDCFDFPSNIHLIFLIDILKTGRTVNEVADSQCWKTCNKRRAPWLPSPPERQNCRLLFVCLAGSALGVNCSVNMLCLVIWFSPGKALG